MILKLSFLAFIFLSSILPPILGDKPENAPNCTKDPAIQPLLDNPDLGLGGKVILDPEVSTTTTGELESSTETSEVKLIFYFTEVKTVKLFGFPVSTTSIGPSEPSTNIATSSDQTTPSSEESSASTAPSSSESSTLEYQPTESTTLQENELTSTSPEPTSGPTTAKNESPTSESEPSESTTIQTIISSTPVSCSNALCSIQNMLQQLVAQLLEFLQSILGDLLAPLGIDLTNLG
ncbi:hypothetical protein L5515_010382 [Caenorhabditis briggsae]|uniref:Uncharacterized protein n=1 Tax=Caenorhabditis briggsae TaxID=6238 RepID=A0AAE9JD43_CAEBR|nr:hypothetical protein L5515_010382 [Caenorhabditis briggsae]